MSHSLYVHIPLCIQKCTYCDFFSDPRYLAASNKITDTLCAEIFARASAAGVGQWDTVYIGGGTPSLLALSEIVRLTDAIRESAPLAEGAEWTIEANPEDLTQEWLDGCARAGINRLSVGIQSMNDRELAAVGRRGNRLSNLKALELLKLHWRGKLSLDLIAALPGQTGASLAESLAHVCNSGASHISLYSLTLEEGTALSQSVSRGTGPELPDADEADRLWLAGRDTLIREGFKQYEVSNFAREGDESRHNQTYWRMGNWIGAGPSASGTIQRGSEAVRVTNTDGIDAWLSDPTGSAETEVLSAADCEKETLIMGMRLLAGLDRRNFAFRFGRDILEVIGRTCESWKKNGLLNITAERIALTGEGILLLNRFLAECLEEMD